jgi:hypothetical protein
VLVLVIAIGIMFAAWPVLVGWLVDLLESQPNAWLLGLAGLALVVPPSSNGA